MRSNEDTVFYELAAGMIILILLMYSALFVFDRVSEKAKDSVCKEYGYSYFDNSLKECIKSKTKRSKEL